MEKKKEPVTVIHQHYVYRFSLPNILGNVPELGKEFLSELVRAIGMVAVTDPQCVYVPDDGNEGITGSINLATSHIAFHVFDHMSKTEKHAGVRGSTVMMDVYSCKDFDPMVPVKVFSAVFGQNRIRIIYVTPIPR